ncbi:MAG: hypothetical protein SFV21_08905 [Rhodospirillaceae bacterium]|nr:hypothetical protein [Rhodospirillaceae bacterium]
MPIDPSLESVLGAKRADLLNKIGNSAQGAQQTSARDAAERIADKAAQRAAENRKKDDERDDLPVDPKRGRNVNFNT